MIKYWYDEYNNENKIECIVFALITVLLFPMLLAIYLVLKLCGTLKRNNYEEVDSGHD